jgi:eukaryotic-like serine/threonine-protein kinase
MSLQAGVRLGPYEVLSLLGSGGMGEVYRARDVRLGRDVAVKVLASSFAEDSMRLHRFAQEARSVAALSHPNILAIFDVGQEPVPFLVTELLDGETLRGLLDRGPLPLAKLTDVALQFSAGLAAAHAGGIVHRDLKPANLFVTRDGVVKILDFGLAKAAPTVWPGAVGDLTAAPTLDGTVVGTLAYMAPEQVRGAPADHRSDVFACGAILYEMLTGRRAFQGDSPADTMSAILREHPPEPELKGHSPALVRIIRRCLEKEPDRRFQSVRELRSAIESLTGATRAAVSRTGERSVAVLPFADMSVQKDQEYFCEGMAEELINALSKLPQLRVASRTSSFRFKGAQDIHHIGRQLGVDSVVEGSVRTAGKRLRVSAQLTTVNDGYQVWSDRYDRDLDDIFAVQDEIARAIVDNLKLKLGASFDAPLVRRPTDNLEAYNLYLQGRYQWIRRNAASLQKAATLFEQAVAQDSSYALAYAGLADSYMTLGHYGVLPMMHAYAKAKPAAERAVSLDPDLAEGHQAVAQTMWLFERDKAGAEREYRLAIERRAESGLIRLQLAVMLSWYGRIDDAIAEAQTGYALEPVSPLVGFYLAIVQLVAGHYEMALDQCKRLVELDPRYVLAPWAEALIRGRMSQHDQAIEAAEHAAALSNRQTFFLAALGAAYGAAGRGTAANAIVAELEGRSRKEYVQPLHFGEIFASLGDADLAFAWLDRAYAEHNSFLGLAVANPAYDSVRADPRFIALMKQMGT